MQLVLQKILYSWKLRLQGDIQSNQSYQVKNSEMFPLITALNAQKDRINELGSAQFAAETGQSLIDFYSIDRFGSPPDVAEKQSRGKKSKAFEKHVSNEI